MANVTSNGTEIPFDDGHVAPLLDSTGILGSPAGRRRLFGDPARRSTGPRHPRPPGPGVRTFAEFLELCADADLAALAATVLGEPVTQLPRRIRDTSTGAARWPPGPTPTSTPAPTTS